MALPGIPQPERSRTPQSIDRGRIAELTERESAALDERTAGSGKLYERARKVLSAGVASHYQARDPWPIYLSHGAGPRVWDVDGNEYFDFHNGYGSMVPGHRPRGGGCRRHGVLRLPHRLRLEGRGACAPGDRPRRPRAL